MLSRVANSIYWMSRYIERAENVARLIDVNFNLILDMPTGANEQWAPLVLITGDREPFLERYGKFTRENVIEFLTFDPANPNSIIASLRAARENGRSIREIVSSEMWEELNSFYLMVRDPMAQRRVEDNPHEFFDAVKKASFQFVGTTDTTMTHGEGWHFHRLGRLMERADKTSRIVDVKYFLLLPTAEYVGTPLDDMQWAALLRSTSAFEMYRKRFGRTRPDRVVQFLILDREFPRSILYCLTKGRESLHAISGTPLGMYSTPAEQRLGRLVADLAYTNVQQVIDRGLHEFLDNFQTDLNRVDDGVFDTFFALEPTTQSQVQYQ